MESTQIFSSISKLLTSSFEREFWLNLQDELAASYANANAIVDSAQARIDRPEKIRLLPQMRHYFLNAAFRRAAIASGLVCTDAMTEPKGENYCIVQSGGIKVSRIGLKHDEHLIKRAHHRTLIAQLNSELEGFTPDLFNEITIPEHPEGTLGVLIVNVNPPYILPQSTMMDLRVTVPFTNLNNYHYNQSVRDILALYNEPESVPELPDLAIPQLKKRLKQQEG